MNTFWRERRVLVTGATGLVGYWLVKSLLANQAAVIALVRDDDPQSEFIRSGLCSKTTIVTGKLEDFLTCDRAINDHDVDTIFHLGAQALVGPAYRSPLQTFESNIRGTYNLLEACRIHKGLVKRIVVASSDKAYGTQAVLPYVETTPLQGQQPYEVSKSCTDLIAQSYFHTYGLTIGIARCGNIYGGGDLNWSRIVPGTIRALFQGKQPVIRSDGTFIRDYIFVQDVVQAYMTLAEQVDRSEVIGNAFNFSPERPVSVIDLATMIRAIMGCEQIEFDIQNKAHNEIHSQFLDSSKARKVLNWSPQFSIQAGLNLTIEWYRNYLKEVEIK